MTAHLQWCGDSVRPFSIHAPSRLTGQRLPLHAEMPPEQRAAEIQRRCAHFDQVEG
jgi:hypothetical protein